MRGTWLVSMLSLAAGMWAAMIAAVWVAACWQAGWNEPLPRDIGDVEALVSLRGLWAAYLLGLPLLSALAVVFGLLSWREPPAKIGVLLAAAALAVFAASTTAGFLVRA